MPDAVSLDLPVNVGGTTRIGDFVEDEQASDVASAVMVGRGSEHLRLAVCRLPEQERHVLVRRYGLDDREPVSMAVLSVELGISKKQVSELQRRAEGTLLRSALTLREAVA